MNGNGHKDSLFLRQDPLLVPLSPCEKTNLLTDPTRRLHRHHDHRHGAIIDGPRQLDGGHAVSWLIAHLMVAGI